MRGMILILPRINVDPDPGEAMNIPPYPDDKCYFVLETAAREAVTSHAAKCSVFSVSSVLVTRNKFRNKQRRPLTVGE